MCLIALALNVSPEFPLILAANRDEFYDRPSLRAHRWTDAPHVIGGRDVTAGGSWLAISRHGRFAAVTNLRGAASKERSRGLLVSDFVIGGESVSSPELYAGFNLITGQAGGETTLISNADNTVVRWQEGIYAVGNDPPHVESAKVSGANDAMRAIVSAPHTNASLIGDLMDFLFSPDAFVETERYGTRASTVIIASEHEIMLVEVTSPDGDSVNLQLRRG